VQALLNRADVRLDGNRPWDLQVKDQRLFSRLLWNGSLGLGESYMDDWWDCERMDELICRLLKADLDSRLFSPRELIDLLLARCMNMQCRSRVWIVGERHYDIGEDLYRAMLDDKMIYSCAYWKDAADLDAAQDAKLDLIARKLHLERGMKVLDIGCGWGGAARYLAERYEVEVTGVTISKNQAATARERCKGLPVDIRLEDYRSLHGRFDRIYSVGMFEHVGYKNYKPYMLIVRDLLVKDGLFLLHTIGSGSSRKEVRNDPWIERYIFPCSMLPSADQLLQSFGGLFLLEDWHNFGVDYDKTLMQWYRNFEAAWPELAEGYGERFYRMWKYYLLACAASFRVRKNQLWQLVLAPAGVEKGYESVR
jgi:cyclopropane-fatty-acyl-phospholipid synthase